MSDRRDLQVQRLARAVLERLPAEQLVSHELEDFEANAATWQKRVSGGVSGREGASGFGLDSIVPEATQLALIVAQAAVGVVIEGGLRTWWQRRRDRPASPRPLTPAQVAKVRAELVSTLIGGGATRETAQLFADTVVGALEHGTDGESGT